MKKHILCLLFALLSFVGSLHAQGQVASGSFREAAFGLNMNMVKVPAGSFIMGSPDGVGYDSERPAHRVTLSSFLIGETEVTQAQWRSVMGSDPPELYHKGCDDCPVERVSWDDAQAFISKLNAQTGKSYRLPTEAEWEYAARGGQSYTYSGSNDVGTVGWYYGNSGDQLLSGDWDVNKLTTNHCRTHAVGQKPANGYGIKDMTGNVWEWCSDWYGSYSSESQPNPQGPSKGSNRVFRGGGWSRLATSCRVADRRDDAPDDRGYLIGFRLAMSSSSQ